MSDSEAGDLPSHAIISRTLKSVVDRIHKEGNPDELTVKRVRSRAEQELKLQAGFFKESQEWKQKSNDIIHEAVESLEDAAPAPSAAPTPKKTAKAKAKPAPPPKISKAASDGSRGVKRKAAAPVKKAAKRKKVVVSSVDEPDAELSDSVAEPDVLSDVESEPSKKPVRRTKKVVQEESDEDEDAAPGSATRRAALNGDSDGAPTAATNATAKKSTNEEDEKSESEMSSLIDESPVKKKRKTKSLESKGAKKTKGTEAKATKPRAKSNNTNDDPDLAEIKRLQGWLVKCGIRKVWSKELAKCDSSKEKIRHLKAMLKEAGMEGKFSVEKAAKIKEQREFARDLEAIQEGEKSWGKVEDVGTGGRPRRKAAQAARPVIVQDPEDSEGDSVSQKEESHDDDGSDHEDAGGKGDSDGSGSDSESPSESEGYSD